MAGILALAADGFEEIELITVLDVLRRAGIRIHVASTSGDSLMIQGGHDIVIQSDILLKDAALETYDWLFIPGGGVGVENLQKNHRVSQLLQNWSQKHIAAICAGPLVLANEGLLTGVRVTGYPSTQKELEQNGAIYTTEDIVMHHDTRKIVTSQGPATAMAFALYLVKELASEKAAQQVALKMLVKTV